MAIAEARRSLAEEGIAVGAIPVKDNKVIAQGHSRKVQYGDSHGSRRDLLLEICCKDRQLLRGDLIFNLDASDFGKELFAYVIKAKKA